MTDTEIFVESPCMDNCCLDDDDICLGCFRSLEEIKRWSNASNQERLVMLRNASQRRNAKSPSRQD